MVVRPVSFCCGLAEPVLISSCIMLQEQKAQHNRGEASSKAETRTSYEGASCSGAAESGDIFVQLGKLQYTVHVGTP